MSNTSDQDEGKSTVGGGINTKELIQILGMIVLIAVVVPFLIYAVPQAVGADYSYVVLSGSMEPAMSPGDVILVKSVDPSTIEEDDIITYSTPVERLTTHRVIEVIKEDGTYAFRTKGDANEDPDKHLVRPDELQGKVMTVGGYPVVIPYIGYVIQSAGTQFGFVALFVVPLVLLVLSELWNVGTDQKDDSNTSTQHETEAVTADQTASETDRTDNEPSVPEEQSSDTADDVDSQTETDTGDNAVSHTADTRQLGIIALGSFFAYSVCVGLAMGEIVSVNIAEGILVCFHVPVGRCIRSGDGKNISVKQCDIPALSGCEGEIPAGDGQPLETGADRDKPFEGSKNSPGIAQFDKYQSRYRQKSGGGDNG